MANTITTKVSFTVDSHTGDVLLVNVGGSLAAGINIIGTGNYIEYIVRDTTGASRNLYIKGNTSAVAQIDNASLVQVLTPSSTGVTIVSTAGGTSFNWTETSGFKRNDTSGYTYAIYDVSDEAMTFYVDPNITDTYVGSATPDFVTYNPITFSTSTGSDRVYKTLADVNMLSDLVPGSNILFRKGSTWAEYLVVPKS
jgi:hypothetical protein